MIKREDRRWRWTDRQIGRQIRREKAREDGGGTAEGRKGERESRRQEECGREWGGDENGEEERSSTLVGDSKHRAFLRFALSFNRAFRACSRRARTEEPERSAIVGPILKARDSYNEPSRNMRDRESRSAWSRADRFRSRSRKPAYPRDRLPARDVIRVQTRASWRDQMKNPRDGESHWSCTRIQLDTVRKLICQWKTAGEHRVVHRYINRTYYGSVRACFFLPLKRTSAGTCAKFPPVSTVKSAETSRVRNCSFVRVAISLPAFSTGKHVTLSRWMFQTFFSAYMTKDSNLILGRIGRSVHAYDWRTSRNSKETWC